MDAKQTTDNVGYAISVFLLYLFDGLIAIDDAGLHQDGDDAISFQTYLVYCDFCGLQADADGDCRTPLCLRRHGGRLHAVVRRFVEA